MSFRKQFADARSLNFANSADLSHTLRVKLDVANKTIKGVTVLNNRLEFVEALTGSITEGDTTVNEALSLRVSLSGSVGNAAALQARWQVLKSNVDAAIADGALGGFLPENAVMVTSL